MRDAHDPGAVANLMLDQAKRRGINKSNLALQKPLYFAHGIYLTKNNRPLVSGYFEAWQYGPVYSAVYRVLEGLGSDAIAMRAVAKDPLTGKTRDLPLPNDPDVSDLIEEVVKRYGNLSPARLFPANRFVPATVTSSTSTLISTSARRLQRLGRRLSVRLQIGRRMTTSSSKKKGGACGLYDFATTGRVIGRKREFFPLAMRAGRKVTFWQSMAIAIDDAPHAIFIEPRRTRGLTADGRRFVFSMMHERIRAADEDVVGIGLALVRFDDPNEVRRAARPFTDKGVTLGPLDKLESMVASPYDMWRDMLWERERQARRRPTGTGRLASDADGV